MANTTMDTTFQNLINVIKDKTAAKIHTHDVSDVEGAAELTPKYSDTWETKAWNEYVSGKDIWTDGDDVYFSSGSAQKVLNKTTGNWDDMTWTGCTNYSGSFVWSDGTDIYLSQVGGGSTKQYILDKTNHAWVAKSWDFSNFNGDQIWSDGENVYYSRSSTQKVLNKSTKQWDNKTWNAFNDYNGQYIWTDGTDVYYSYNAYQYVLNKSTSTWEPKTWVGLTSFQGQYIWTDGTDIYYSNGSDQYVLNKIDSTWIEVEWSGISALSSFKGDNVWTDGTDIYCNNSSYIYIKRLSDNAIEGAIIVKSNKDIKAVGNIFDKNGANLSQEIANIKIDIADIGISKIGISQIGVAGGVAAYNHTHTVSQISDFPTLGTAAGKNITISTTDLTPGTSTLATGDIYLVYEA